MLLGRQEDSFATAGEKNFCMAFVKSMGYPWIYSSCNKDVDFVSVVIDTCLEHDEMNIDANRISMHGNKGLKGNFIALFDSMKIP